MEFYFSDSNLPGDQFLLKSIEESGDDCILSTKFVLARCMVLKRWDIFMFLLWRYVYDTYFLLQGLGFNMF